MTDTRPTIRPAASRRRVPAGMVPAAQVVELLKEIAASLELPRSAYELEDRDAELTLHRHRIAYLAGAISVVAESNEPAGSLLSLADTVRRNEKRNPVTYALAGQ